MSSAHMYMTPCAINVIIEPHGIYILQNDELSLEGGDLSELRADDLENSVLSESVGLSTCADTAKGSRVVSNLAEQMSQATNTAMKARRDDSDDSMLYEDASHPALQMAFR